MHINFEFKAKTSDPDRLEQLLQQYNPRFVGEDHQIDTYFNVPSGRLKLREGTIEHALIHYERPDYAAAKTSQVILYQHQPNDNLKAILVKTLGIKVVVDKRRRIYFVDNVKFHFDRVAQLGTFVEVEAIDAHGSLGMEKIQEQCRLYAGVFGLEPGDYIAQSYSDLLLSEHGFGQ